MTSKVARIKSAVENGTYKIDPAAVAEAILAGEKQRAPNLVSPDVESKVRALHYDGLSNLEIGAELGIWDQTVGRILARHHRPAILSHITLRPQ